LAIYSYRSAYSCDVETANNGTIGTGKWQINEEHAKERRLLILAARKRSTGIFCNTEEVCETISIINANIEHSITIGVMVAAKNGTPMP
jgi:hypothetical protein